MDTSAWIEHLDESIDRLPRALERACAWAGIAHAIARADLLRDPALAPGVACWVEPRMAWILDDFASAGVHTDPIPVPAIAADDVASVLLGVLDRLIASAAASPRRASPAQVDAAARTLARAITARADLLTTPT